MEFVIIDFESSCTLVNKVKLLMKELSKKNKVLFFVQASFFAYEVAPTGEIWVQHPFHNRAT